jgi:hypothetical protein
MNALQPTKPNPVRVMWLAVALAMIAALAYLMIAWNILGVGDLNMTEAPPAIVFVSAGCYILGGLLILLRRRWLWIIGIVINAMVMLFFFQMYQARPAVMFSPGGIATKAAQLLLEITLIYLLLTDWVRSRRPSGK